MSRGFLASRALRFVLGRQQFAGLLPQYGEYVEYWYVLIAALVRECVPVRVVHRLCIVLSVFLDSTGTVLVRTVVLKVGVL